MVGFQGKMWRHIFIGRVTLLITILCFIHINPYVLSGAQATSAGSVPRSLNGNANPRLPRTSASQLSSAPTNLKFSSKSLNTSRNASLRTR